VSCQENGQPSSLDLQLLVRASRRPRPAPKDCILWTPLLFPKFQFHAEAYYRKKLAPPERAVQATKKRLAFWVRKLENATVEA
jgi:hypothetical protein